MTFWIMIAAAVFSVVLGTGLVYYGQKLFGVCTSQAAGTVVDICQSSFSQDEGYAPVIEFYAQGQKIRSRTQTEKTGRRNRIPFEIGDEVKILYNPDNPRQFLVEGYDQNIIVYVGISGYVAAVLLVIVAFVLA